MNIIVFEDSNINNLKPFSINHASFEVKCGLYSNLERIVNNFNDDSNFYLIVRDELKPCITTSVEYLSCPLCSSFHFLVLD